MSRTQNGMTSEMDGVAGKIGMSERRAHRRHDMESREILVDRWDGSSDSTRDWGRLMDISAGGIRIRTTMKDVRPATQVRVRLMLPAFAGISPFVRAGTRGLEPRREWVGWMTVARVTPIGNGREVDIAGRLADMDDIDRGMLSLYLSTQPLAA